MVISLVITAMIFAVLVLLFFNGNRTLKSREETLRNIGKQSGGEIEYHLPAAYQGGFMEIPKPQKLTAAIIGSTLVLLTHKGKGKVGVLPLSQWQKIDKFTTIVRQDPKHKSLILWGPLSNILFPDRKRYFIVVNYQYRDGDDNHILIEYQKKEQMEEFYERMNVKLNHLPEHAD